MKIKTTKSISFLVLMLITLSYISVSASEVTGNLSSSGSQTNQNNTTSGSIGGTVSSGSQVSGTFGNGSTIGGTVSGGSSGGGGGAPGSVILPPSSTIISAPSVLGASTFQPTRPILSSTTTGSTRTSSPRPIGKILSSQTQTEVQVSPVVEDQHSCRSTN